ncbi:MAG: Tim44 domain-containing protein [Beijerinckiaceae bacterium]
MSMRRKTFILALAAALALGMAGDAFARPLQGLSLGSRGTRTYSMPAPTPTNPNGASQFNRSMAPSPNQNIFRPGMSRSPGFFSGGFMGGLLSGFIGAGLFGLLFGHGLFGGIGGGFSLIGLLIQLGLIYLLVRFALNFFRNRNPAFFGGPQGAAYQGAGPVPASGYGAPSGGAPLPIAAEDFNTFERRLGEVQAAYSGEDLGALRRLATPEMAAYFNEELTENKRRGVVNHLSGTKLLKGDLSEAWRENGSDYATVAMRYSLIDTMVEQASGRVVSGNASVPDVVTEVWTFVRPAATAAEDWMLSAIQQA